MFHWIRKRYDEIEGIQRPTPFITSDEAVKPVSMPDTDGVWQTSMFVDPTDIRHDMHVNIVTFQPGALYPLLKHTLWNMVFMYSKAGVLII